MNAMLEAELLAHLDGQIASAQRLLRLVLTQGEAIRKRDVDAVLARLADIQTADQMWEIANGVKR